jgi:hypothetical protein
MIFILGLSKSLFRRENEEKIPFLENLGEKVFEYFGFGKKMIKGDDC